ncbi:uncharacterized protein LOC123690046 [Pieris rapae]|uniref:uncharacterized protein LOC123690046 n=1 Tax=Pieris rapae TaxID=64459 RepID=UPI001E27B5C6|nr:uncharacterized protein LOC123690046 [Pieris rapae]
MLQIPSYTHYYNYRQNKRGGGVSIFVHNNLKHHLVEEKCVDDTHYLWVYVKKFSLNIGAIYKPNKMNVDDFLEIYSQQLHKLKRTIVFGDYNLDLLNPDSATRKYKNTLKENNYKILNKISPKHCTRETNSTKTMLDHVSCNLSENNFHIVTAESSMSDHKQILLEIKQYQPPTIIKQQYNAVDLSKLYRLLDQYPKNHENVEYNELARKLQSCLNKCRITKVKFLNPPRQDWIKKDLLEEINRKNILWQKYKTNAMDTNLKAEYEHIKARVSHNIRKSKSEYYCKRFEENSSKPRKMWQLINELSKNKLHSRTGPDKLETEAGTITDKKEICESFNSYFSTIGSTLANMISKKSKVIQILEECRLTDRTELRFLKPVTTKEVITIIKNFDCNTASGIDGISTKSIKCVKDIIATELTLCINYHLARGTFPNELKVAKIVPIHKAGSKFDPCNYRPISVLPVLSKVFEKILYKRLHSFLNSKDFFYQKQYGFRAQSNTLAATIDLVTKIKNKIDQKQLALGIFIDLKKAFDTISHEKLLQKLELTGVTGKALEIFKSYMENRTQIVKIGEYESNPCALNYGVPQGSILGPLLFLTYINSIFELGLKGDISLYADDTSLFYFGNSVEVLVADAQNDLNLLHEWFQSNLLTINITKTNYVIFAAKNKKINNNFELKIDEKLLERKTKEKYLGLTLDSNLTWKPHLEKIKLKLIPLTGALRNITNCLPRKVRYLIYNSLVKPHIDYLIEVWGYAINATSSNKSNPKPMYLLG